MKFTLSISIKNVQSEFYIIFPARKISAYTKIYHRHRAPADQQTIHNTAELNFLTG